MKQQRVVVITGMHRSATSLVASLLRHAGVNVGDHLIGPDEGNKYGYFEDSDFNSFHVELLKRFGQGFLVQSVSALGVPGGEEVKAARALIGRRKSREIWGWKDPRTCLFLDFWHNLLPQARYVFVYRHPVEVVLSLLRRGRDFDSEALVNPLTALRSWQTHNQSLLDFFRRHPNSCVLGHVSTISDDPEAFIERTANKLKLPLRSDGAKVLYDHRALKRMSLPAKAVPILRQIAPGAMTLYGQLEAHADLPGRASAKAAVRPGSQLRTLQRIASRLGSDDPLQEDRRDQLFQLLLTTIEPQAVLGGKEALDKIRMNRIGSLETKATDLRKRTADQKKELDELAARTAHWASQQEQLGKVVAGKEEQLRGLSAQAAKLGEVIASQEAQLRGQAAHAAEMQQLLVSKQDELQKKSAHTGQLERLLANSEAQLQEKSTHVGQLEEQSQEKTAHVAELEQALASKVGHVQQLELHAGQLGQLRAVHEAHAHSLQEKLTAIESSRAWRCAKKWYALKQFLGFKPKPGPAGVQAPARFSVVTSSGRQSRRSPNAPPAVLFISHDAQRYGAPILLLNLLKWLKANTDLPFEILLKADGELRTEFEALAHTTVWSESAREEFENANIALIYSNTITNGRVLAALSSLNCPTVCHVHELEYRINYQTESENTQQIKAHTTFFIAGSEAVKQNLVENLQIPADRVEVVYDFISPKSSSDERNRTTDQIRNELQIPRDALVVGAAGTTDWRKGADLFIHLARAIHQRRLEKPVHLVWIGGATAGPEFGALWHDVKHIGVERYVHFVPARPDFLDYLATFDVFTLISREDPCPLVNLEAALMGIPIVCFEGAGGAPEFVETDCGFIVPYLDIERMADRVVELFQNPDLRERLGEHGAKKVWERHDVALAGPKITAIIGRLLSRQEDTPRSHDAEAPDRSSTAPATVSVCIPTYNGAKYLGEAIASVLQQTRTDFELLITDDCSEDDTEAVVHSFNDARIKYFKNPSRLGLVGNWNRCLELANGRYVSVFHQDDIMMPSNLEEKVEILEKNQNVGMVYSNVAQIGSAGELLSEWWYFKPEPDQETVQLGLDHFKLLFSGVNIVCCPSVVARNECYERLGGFDSRLPFATDLEMWMRIALFYDVACLPETLVKYRRHEGIETNNFLGAKELEHSYKAKIIILDKHPERIPNASSLRTKVASDYKQQALEQAISRYSQAKYTGARPYLELAMNIHGDTVENPSWRTFSAYFREVIDQMWRQDHRGSDDTPSEPMRPRPRPSYDEIVGSLTGEQIANEIPTRKLIRAVAFRIAAKRGFQWLHRYMGLGKQPLGG